MRSTYVGGEIALAILSGTSMVSPYTASLLGYLLSLYPSTRLRPNVGPDFSSIFQEPEPPFGAEQVYKADTGAALALGRKLPREDCTKPAKATRREGGLCLRLMPRNSR
ncbi:hypothetical protein FOMPIDRAFT_1050093 [Fomitopsis schrenkii]|uniref:Peptidase S8/S53 domain-containing protein n=1 Tax=Fomitopsis schrenkii TaxID=2126942 RepID=S8FNW8_FOMSC|nr:hypothetical protein FOMPIDRAFT_1050093 [Fomitopsis schrenkii]